MRPIDRSTTLAANSIISAAPAPRRALNVALSAAGVLALLQGCASQQSPSAQPAAASEPGATVDSSRSARSTGAEAPPIQRAGSTQESFGVFGDVSEASFSEQPEPAPGENLRQVSFALEGSDLDPTLSPDGNWIYFASTAHRATPDLYVKAVDGKTITQLTSDPASDVMPAVSPDGTRVAFASNRSGNWDLYIIQSTGGQAVQLTSDSAHELHPSWSPDGKSLVFCKLGEVSGRWEIWTTDTGASATKRFLTYGLFPDWHPTAPRIAYQRARERGDHLFSIWTLDLVRGEASNLTEVAANPTAAFVNPDWSPDGTRLAFSAVSNPSESRSGEGSTLADIVIVDAHGGSMSNLTGGQYGNLSPTWGPDGTIYFVSDRGGIQNLWSTDSTGAINAGQVREMASASPAANKRKNGAQPMQSPAGQDTMITSAPVRMPGTTVLPAEPAGMHDAHSQPAMATGLADEGPMGEDAAPELANVPIGPDSGSPEH